MGKSKKFRRQKASSHPYRKTENTPSKSRPLSKSACNVKPSAQHSRSHTIPFSKSDKILLVGEGDFSFSHSLLTHHNCTSITATSYDPLPALLSKYPQSISYIQALTSAGQTVLHGIDATKLGRPGNIGGGGGKRISEGGFDRIVFNFPHTGGLTKNVNRQVRANQELLAGFFKAAIPLLKECSSSKDRESPSPLSFSTSANSIPLSSSSRRPCSLSPSALLVGSPHGSPTIIVTLFDGEPYTLWNIRDLARHVGLAVKRSFAFDFEAYPGYVHRRTLGNVEGGWKGEKREARCFVLEVPGQEGQGEGEGRRKRKGSGKNDDDSE